MGSLASLKNALKTHKNTHSFLYGKSAGPEKLFNTKLACKLLTDICPGVA
jgi:hypothetical protein